MAYNQFKPAGGLQLKADATSIPDGTFTSCRYCAFDTVGAVTSARGRVKANNGSALGGSGTMRGGFDGGVVSTLGGQQGLNKMRFLKRGTSVYYGAIAAGLNTTATYTSTVPSLPPTFLGGTAPTFNTSNTLSGFCYNGYAYMADGQGMTRFNYNDGGTPASETWGLASPGYHELTTAPLSTTSSSTTVTATVSGGHGLGYGIADSPSYPYTMNVELVGLASTGGVLDNDINCVHAGQAATNGDIAVTNTQATLAVSTNVCTITFQNGAGAYDWPTMVITGSTIGGGSIAISRSTRGSSSPPTDCIQTITTTGTLTSGSFQLKISNGAGTNYTTAAIAYNATAATVKSTILAVPFFSAGTNAKSTVSVTDANTFTFTVSSAATSTTSSAGGTIGFMRQGPTLTGSTGGGLTTGTYYYAYTFFNGVAESNFSAQVPYIATSGDKVALSQILRGPAGTTKRRIYRTDVNARQLYYIGEIADNTSTTFTDLAGLASGADPNTTQGASAVDQERPAGSTDSLSTPKRAQKRGILAQQAASKAAQDKKQAKLATNLGLLSDWTDHDPPPTNIKHVGMLNTTCFGISGTDLVFSEGGNPEHFPLSNRITPNKNTSETLQAWVPFDRDCIVYTDTGLYRLSQIGVDFSDSRFEEIESPVGLAGEWAVAALDGQRGHIFLAKSGLYLFDGARVTEISFPIEPLFTDSTNADYINPKYMSQAVMTTTRDRAVLAYRSTNSSGANDRMLWIDMQDPANPCISVLSWEVTTVWREKSDNSVVAGDSNGQPWILDSGWSEGGSSTIAWAVTSKDHVLDDGDAVSIDEVVLDADFNGVDTTVTVATRLRGKSRSNAIVVTGSTGRQRIVLKQPFSLRGEVANVTVSSSSNTKRVLYAYGFTYLPLGEV